MRPGISLLLFLLLLCSCKRSGDEGTSAEEVPAEAAPAGQISEQRLDHPAASACAEGDEGACEKACTGGHARSCTLWALKLQIRWVRDEVSKEDILRVNQRGCELGDGPACYGAKQYAKAIELMSRQCDEDQDAHSCRDLAFAYQSGKRVSKDISKAAALFRKACTFGNEIGCINAERLGASNAEAPQHPLLGRWVAAQNSGDFDAYSKLYAPDFQGVKNVGGTKKHFNRQGWLNDRKGMFANAFSVKASDAKVDEKDGTQVITFTQTWKSSNYRDQGTKVLHVRDGKVVREEQLTSAPLDAISIGPLSAAEWDSAEMVNTQGASSRPSGCDMRTKGDWVRVVCSGVLGHEQASNLGAKGEDYFLDIESSGKATLVLKMLQGPQQTVRLCRKDERASLLVSWPSAKPRPVHIALGKGPACDGSDWGAKN